MSVANSGVIYGLDMSIDPESAYEMLKAEKANSPEKVQADKITTINGGLVLFLPINHV